MTMLMTSHIDSIGRDYWQMAGPKGAITFTLGGGIEAHARAPRFAGDEPLEGCRYVDFPCHAGGSGLRARDLERQWRAADCDDAVIQRELEDWYNQLPQGDD